MLLNFVDFHVFINLERSKINKHDYACLITKNSIRHLKTRIRVQQKQFLRN